MRSIDYAINVHGSIATSAMHSVIPNAGANKFNIFDLMIPSLLSNLLKMCRQVSECQLIFYFKLTNIGSRSVR
jgi:hypothetical protein